MPVVAGQEFFVPVSSHPFTSMSCDGALIGFRFIVCSDSKPAIEFSDVLDTLCWIRTVQTCNEMRMRIRITN